MKNSLFRNIQKVLDDGSMLHYSWYKAMYTRMDILLHGDNQGELEQLSIRIYELVHKFNKMSDRFNAGSEISKVNKYANNAPIQISDHLFNMFSQCIDANEKTRGLFDITINSTNHNAESIKTIKVDSDSKTVYIPDPATILDLNGYVKGYTIDKIRDLISATPVENALVNLGNSSILGLGHHPFGKGWKVKGLTNPIPDIILYNECLTTSGNIVAGRRHIKHPVSHEYVLGDQTVSIVTPTGSLGEVLSTSLLLAEKEQQADILERFGMSEECLIQRV